MGQRQLIHWGRRPGGKLLIALMSVGVVLPLTAGGASAASADLTGGGGAVWRVFDSLVTDNGLPAGDFCSASDAVPAGSGAGVQDARLPTHMDAFDRGVMFWVANTQVGGTLSATPNSAVFAPVSTAGLTVQLRYQAMAGSPTLRALLTLANPTAAPITVSVDYASNFGSDSTTAVQATSSGDLAFTAADRWLITDDASTTIFDMANTTVLYGPGSPAVTPTSVSQTVFHCPGPEGVRATYSVTVPAGATRRLMLFHQMNTTSADAITAAAVFNTTPALGSDLLEGLTAADLAEVVNWDYGTGTTCPATFDFDFSGDQYANCFRDAHRGGEINADPDLTAYSALNFTGLTGAGGATWLTVYDATPDTPAPGPTYGEARQTFCADILFARFNNLKGAGIVALLNEGVDQKGLALILSNAGNTDLLRLATIEGDAIRKGKFTVLDCRGLGNSRQPCSVPLKNGIAENVWYRLIMTVEPTVPRVTGQVWTHAIPSDPNSDLGFLVGTPLTWEPAPPGGLPDGVSAEGQTALMAQAVSAVVDLSITNFTNDRQLCQTPPVK